MEIMFLFGALAVAPLVAAYFIDNKVIKGVLCGLSFIFCFVFAVMFSLVIAFNYNTIHGFWVPFTICSAVFLISQLLIWKPFKMKTRVISMVSVAVVALSVTAIFIIPAVYNSSIPVSREEVFLPEYTPFGRYWYVDGVLTHHESRTAKLNEPSALSLTGELPRLDGATALYPLYAAFVQATYPAPAPDLDIPEYSTYGELSGDYASLIVCSRTAGAFANLIDGYADIIFLMGVSDEQVEWAEKSGYEIVLTPVGREAFVFFVNSRNTVTDISTRDIRRIYSGEVTNWQDVGGRNNEIRAYQRPDTSGSQVMLEQIMGDIPIVPAEHEVFDTMMGMYSEVANYKNYRNSLGYSFLYYIRDMIGENKVKFLSVDGVTPVKENIESGAYPFANDFYAITLKKDGEYLNPERGDNIDKLLEWIVSSQGQYLVEETGYVRAG
ncbi:MAG: substrate-binding domain-containing protein [Oscillospiraceae bacterium]|nr:substrate-binding domain-containing protein [Oscillospiraceae bacterium]